MRKLFELIILLAVIALCAYGYLEYKKAPGSVVPTVVQTDYKNIAYTINGQTVTLVNGRAVIPLEGSSASETIVSYFGNEAIGDLNDDGLPDRAFLLTENSGGSGTFFYVVAALKTIDGYVGTAGVLLGDRIAPQATEIKNGMLVVNYADRKKGEPMTTQPSVGMSKYFKVDELSLVSVGPVTTIDARLGERCGGNMPTAPKCATSLRCAPVPGSQLPFGDVGGICVKD